MSNKSGVAEKEDFGILVAISSEPSEIRPKLLYGNTQSLTGFH